MPRAGIDNDWIADRENEIARFIEARRHVEALRALAHILRRRDFVTEAYYQDMLDSLDYISGALLIGKRNTAQLRNRKEPL